MDDESSYHEVIVWSCHWIVNVSIEPLQIQCQKAFLPFHFPLQSTTCSDHDEAGAPGQAQQDRARHEEAELLGEAQTRRRADHVSE